MTSRTALSAAARLDPLREVRPVAVQVVCPAEEDARGGLLEGQPLEDVERLQRPTQRGRCFSSVAAR